MLLDKVNPLSRAPNIRAVLLSAHGADSGVLRSMLSEAPSVDIATSKIEDFSSENSSATTDLVIVHLCDVDDRTVDQMLDLRTAAPDIPLIVVSPPLSPGNTRRLFKFNVLDWLPEPVEAIELLETVRKAARSRRSHSHHVHAVVSTVGGCGASTLAIAMADMTVTHEAKKKSRSVGLFDLDFSSGSCGVYVNMPSNFNLGSVAATPRRIDDEFIRLIQQQHEKGFYLYSFKRPDLNTDLNGYELVLRMLDAVSAEHDTTYLDVPYYETEWKDDVFAAVNTCTLVTEANLPAYKQTMDMLQRVRELRGHDFPVNIVINKWRSSLFGQRIGRKKLKELFGETPIFKIPSAHELITEAMDRGVLVSDINRRSGFLRSVRKYRTALEKAEVIA